MSVIKSVILSTLLLFPGIMFAVTWSGSKAQLAVQNKILKAVNQMLVGYIKNSNSRDINVTVNNVDTGGTLVINIDKIKGANNFDIQSNNDFVINNQWSIDKSQDGFINVSFTWKDKIRGSIVKGSAKLQCTKDVDQCHVLSKRLN